MGVLGKINIGGEVSLLAIVLVEIGIVAAVIYLVCKLIKALKKVIERTKQEQAVSPLDFESISAGAILSVCLSVGGEDFSMTETASAPNPRLSTTRHLGTFLSSRCLGRLLATRSSWMFLND